MEKKLETPTTVVNPWNNDACYGYVIRAMENCFLAPETIQQIIDELLFVFDVLTIDAAREYYRKSPY